MVTKVLFFASLAGIINATVSQLLARQPNNANERAGFQIMMTSSSLLFALLLLPFYNFQSIDTDIILPLILFGLANGVFVLTNQITIFEAIKRGPISIIWPVAWLSAPVTGLLWFVFTWFEGFTLWHAAGLSFFVISLLFMRFGMKKKNSFAQPILPYFFLLVIIGLLSGAFANLIFKNAFLNLSNPGLEYSFSYTTMLYLVSATGIFTFWKFKVKKIEFKKKDIPMAVTCGFLALPQFLIITLVISDADTAGFFCTFAGVAITGAVILSRIFQKDKLSTAVIIGIICALIAIISFSLA